MSVRPALLVAALFVVGATGCVVVPVVPDQPVARADTAPVRFVAERVRVRGEVDEEAARLIAASTAKMLQATIGASGVAADAAAIVDTEVEVRTPFTTTAEVVLVKLSTRLADGRGVDDEVALSRDASKRQADDATVDDGGAPTAVAGAAGLGCDLGPLLLLPMAGGIPVIALPILLIAAVPPVILIGAIALAVVGATASVAGITIWAVATGFDQSTRDWSAAYARAVHAHALHVAATARAAAPPAVPPPPPTPAADG